MNVEQFTCRRLTAALLYPPISLSRQDLALLFAAFSERFEVSSFQYLPDGARFSQGDTEIFVQGGRAQVSLGFTSHFPGLRDRVTDAFRLVAERYSIREFLAFGVKLVAFQPVEGSAAALLEGSLLAIEPERLTLLGPGRAGTGFRFNFQRDALYDLRIEPYFMDLSQIYIELDVNFQPPIASLEEVGRHMGRAYDYLLGDVREFLSGLERPL